MFNRHRTPFIAGICCAIFFLVLHTRGVVQPALFERVAYSKDELTYGWSIDNSTRQFVRENEAAVMASMKNALNWRSYHTFATHPNQSASTNTER